jgi:hypothetical protein
MGEVKMEESVLPNNMENIALTNTMEKIMLANNEVYIGRINSNLCLTAAKEAENQLEMFKDLSMNYDKSENSGTYLFRSPANLESPNTGPGYQWVTETTETNKEIKKHILQQCEELFSSKFFISDSWFLLQTQEEWIDNPFHQHLTSKKQAVVYLQTNEDDYVEFKDKEDESIVEKYKVFDGMLVVFDSDAWHRPCKNSGSKNRISFNNELI